MGIFNRIILTLYTFSLAIISFFSILMAFGWKTPLNLIGASLEEPNGRLLIGIIGFAFFLVSIRLIMFAFHRRGSGQALVHEAALGEIRISLDAVENLVHKVARQVKGVRDIKASVTSGQAGLLVSLRGVVSPDVSIPAVSEEIQSSIKSYVRSVVGAEVAEVRVFVENISAEGKRLKVD